jgi:hypothetical protein
VLLRWRCSGRETESVRSGAGSDGCGEFVESCRDQKMMVSSLGAEFVVPTTQVLQERMAANDDPGGLVGL